jgi:hypothetical protein
VRKLNSINIKKLNIPYRDNEESTERTSTASPSDNIVRGVFRSFWKERNVIGDGIFDPVK